MHATSLAGTVSSIDENGRICIRHGQMPDHDGDFPAEYPKMTYLDVPVSQVRNYTIGQKVNVVLEPKKSKGKVVRV